MAIVYAAAATIHVGRRVEIKTNFSAPSTVYTTNHSQNALPARFVFWGNELMCFHADAVDLFKRPST
jgi:hypothetical protein